VRVEGHIAQRVGVVGDQHDTDVAELVDSNGRDLAEVAMDRTPVRAVRPEREVVRAATADLQDAPEQVVVDA
jgi:hypothetical protein